MVKPIKVNIKTPTPSAASKMYAQHQANRKASGLPDPSDYMKRASEKQKEIDALKNEPPHSNQEGKFMSGPSKSVQRVQSQATPRVNEETELNEISAELKASYKSKAKAQVKEAQPWTKKGEYKDLAKNLIAKRKKGIAKVSEDTELDEDDKMLVQNRSGGRMTVFKKFKDIYKKHGYSPVPGTRTMRSESLEEESMTFDELEDLRNAETTQKSRKAQIVMSAAKKDQFQPNPILDSDVNPQTNKQ